MKNAKKKPKKNFSIQTRPIISLLVGLGLLSAVLLVTMLSVAGNTNRLGKMNKDTKQEGAQEAVQPDSLGGGLLCVVKEIDTGRNQITLYDVEHKSNKILFYSGGTNITDKYGQVIAISQIPIGSMVDVTYESDKNKLTKMNVSVRAWEYVGVNNMSINRTKRIMKIATNKYKYTDDVLVLDGEEFVGVAELAEQDELTIWGYEETIWSITVTRGHGTVKPEDYEALLGARITIGYEAMQQISENMVITVREGNFNLTVENGKYVATKNITIYRNKETVVSLSDMGPEAEKQGRVTFEITPFGAELYIDGELTTYANPLELTYGEHSIEVSLEGYTTYEGSLTVDTAGKTIRINLPEANSDEEADVSETNTAPKDNGQNTSGTTDTNPTQSSEDNDNTNGTTGTNSEEEATVDEDHLVYVQNPIGASVYLDGNFMCTSPGSFKKIIGTHVITFIEDGHETMSYTIEVKDDNLDTYISMPDLLKKESSNK